VISRRTNQLGQDLQKVLDEEAPTLAAISEADAGRRHDGSQGWSRKHEIGHLIDSATNNRVRFVNAALAARGRSKWFSGSGK
jgi:hypothetical protein